VGSDGQVWLEREIEDDGDYKIKIKEKRESVRWREVHTFSTAFYPDALGLDHRLDVH
jgi:hypothetical protein